MTTEELRDRIRQYREDLEEYRFATLSQLHTIVFRAECDLKTLNAIDSIKAQSVRSDFDYLCDKWERVAGIEFTPIALDKIEKDAEWAKIAARRIYDDWLLGRTLWELSDSHVYFRWSSQADAHGNYFSFDKRDGSMLSAFVDVKDEVWKWSPEDLYDDLPDEWIAYYRDERNRLCYTHHRRDDIASTTRCDENGNMVKLTNFREIEKDYRASNCTPYAFFYRRNDDPAGKDHMVLRMLPTSTGLGEMYR